MEICVKSKPRKYINHRGQAYTFYRADLDSIPLEKKLKEAENYIVELYITLKNSEQFTHRLLTEVDKRYRR